ncbi:4-hydroxy-tetrahydrodipicolinate synthase [Nocardia farcinica]|uniref:4-hydroxy-tetrahydrodipicolinate synthase n=1 Tax=Nocardia farcinica TaxID=37329 RepID=UPI00189601D0|nr:4-hydroxy-tetrahydrodipicolinate synthase [Nocardia farcinica]MBF6256001.1 4-hydroxy-tetrahydrodipicolinate synthase [Nocardia farcinica]MBF6371620.1 4-hydroxy-tetrahydrodipicolinate synthase [Nocardia farcinica]
MSFRPSGIFVPLVTPFDEHGAVAAAELARLAHTVLDEGAAGLVALGTTAEPATLSAAERVRVLRVCGEVCRARGVPLIAAVGSNDTAATVRAIEQTVARTDVAAVLTVVPYYVRPSEAGVVAHFEYVAERSPVPVLVYNVPYRTAQTVGYEAMLELARQPGIVGVKQAVGAVDTDTARLIAHAPATFSVLAGEDTLVSPLLAMGARGGILATANVCARELVELHRRWLDGTPDRARELADRLVEPARLLLSEPNPTVIKAVLHARGLLSTPRVRLPLLTAAPSPAVLAAVRALRAEYPGAVVTAGR